MASIKNLALGLGIASGAVVTAWLLTGERKTKTREYIVRRTDTIKKSLQPKKQVFDDSEVHYI